MVKVFCAQDKDTSLKRQTDLIKSPSVAVFGWQGYSCNPLFTEDGTLVTNAMTDLPNHPIDTNSLLSPLFRENFFWSNLISGIHTQIQLIYPNSKMHLNYSWQYGKSKE